MIHPCSSSLRTQLCWKVQDKRVGLHTCHDDWCTVCKAGAEMPVPSGSKKSFKTPAQDSTRPASQAQLMLHHTWQLISLAKAMKSLRCGTSQLQRSMMAPWPASSAALAAATHCGRVPLRPFPATVSWISGHRQSRRPWNVWFHIACGVSHLSQPHVQITGQYPR